MYASRNDLLTTRFSENFSGYTGGGDFLVNDRDTWVNITRPARLCAGARSYPDRDA